MIKATNFEHSNLRCRFELHLQPRHAVQYIHMKCRRILDGASRKLKCGTPCQLLLVGAVKQPSLLLRRQRCFYACRTWRPAAVRNVLEGTALCCARQQLSQSCSSQSVWMRVQLVTQAPESKSRKIAKNCVEQTANTQQKQTIGKRLPFQKQEPHQTDCLEPEFTGWQ